MNSIQLVTNILTQDESEQLEFHHSIRKDAIAKNVCGFLNNNGGQILVGIGKNKEILGIENATKWKNTLQSFLIDNVIPEAPIMVSLEEYDGKELILIKVLAGSKQPYIFDGSIYYRRSTNTVKATSKEISVLIHNRHTTAVHWERQPALGVSWEDLDVDEIYKTMSASRAENRTKDNEHGPMDFLSHFGLFENGYFTNAAVILFAKNPARFIPQSRARIAFLSEGKTSDIYRDDRVLEGNLFSNINTIQSFFEQHLAITSSFAKNDWMRKDNYRIPMSALREGVLNALVHRNYSNPSTTMSILIYPSKLVLQIQFLDF